MYQTSPSVLYKFIFKFAARVITPDPCEWSFIVAKGNSWSSNLRAVAEVAKRAGIQQINIIDFNRDSLTRRIAKRDGLSHVYAPGLAAVFALARSKAIYCQGKMPVWMSGKGTKNGRRHYLIWHGIGFKVHNRRYWKEQGHANFDRCFVASERELMRFHLQMGIPLEKLTITGFPRLNYIVRKSNELPLDMREQINRLRERKKCTKLLLWAPSWELFDSPKFNAEGIIAALLHSLPANWTVGVRFHPVRCEKASYNIIDERLIDLGGAVFPSTEAVLRETDLLMTDISSISLDFLVTGRPIVGFGGHIDELVRVGRIHGDFRRNFPGPWLDCVEDICNWINGPSQFGYFRERRDNLLPFLGEIEGAAQKIVDHVKSEIGG